MSLERTPWPAWLHAGLRLGLAPSAFWNLAMREWRALAAPTASDVLSRSEFDALTARFPDELK